jgi:hypothetical protein
MKDYITATEYGWVPHFPDEAESAYWSRLFKIAGMTTSSFENEADNAMRMLEKAFKENPYGWIAPHFSRNYPELAAKFFNPYMCVKKLEHEASRMRMMIDSMKGKIKSIKNFVEITKLTEAYDKSEDEYFGDSLDEDPAITYWTYWLPLEKEEMMNLRKHNINWTFNY